MKFPIGYSKGAPDPKHNGQAMRSAMKAEWIKSQTSEMDGLWRRGVFQKVLSSSLTPQDRVFTSSFHYKIKRKGGEFDKCKVRLVVQGQHMRLKGEDGVGDYNNAFSPVPAASGFRTILSLATQQYPLPHYIPDKHLFVPVEKEMACTHRHTLHTQDTRARTHSLSLSFLPSFSLSLPHTHTYTNGV